ncbi:MAG: FAD-binding oxidoreductase [Acidobacteria bacterium]|nr:FAD-binding oxidoreductase [Acidobacteriota bacterium]MCA1648789.1 FAD-binding oxidoreductase [Acidobacteriota bacterium]
MGISFVAVILLWHAWDYAADPSGDKDCSPAAPPVAASGPTINDVSCLNPTPIDSVVSVREVEDIRQAFAVARARGVKVSIAGARHSQGGQAFAARNVVLDMRAFNRMTLDESTRVLTVQSGATWHDIQNRLHPRFAVKAMQSTDVFTVGGSISVNAHGMDHQAGSVGRTVRAMRVMLPDGSMHTVSREQEPELFRLVVGGYGLFGVILDADIEVTDNAVYRSGREIMDYRSFPAFFTDRILHDQTYRLMYGHLSTAPQSYLREMLVYTYQQMRTAVATIPPVGDVSGVRLRRLVFNLSKLGSVSMRMKWWAEKHLEPRLESCPAGESDGGLVSRNHPMHDSVPYLMNRLAGETDILQEYFIPRERFEEFIDGLRRITLANRANLLNASVRVVHREDNFLSYAPEDMFAIVLYLNQTTDERGNPRMAQLTRELIDLTAKTGGRFFLPYQLHYTAAQLRRAYPEIDAFFRAKDKYDPGHVLTNTFYNKYGPLILAQ